MENLAGLGKFYQGRRVLITGHSGFKGSWLAYLLKRFGADVTGYSLEPPTDPRLFRICGLGGIIHSVIGDIRDFELLQETFRSAKPEIVFHLAAQPIVRESYRTPRATYETNVMGTVNLMECVRGSADVRSVLNVTTDKVYYNPPEMMRQRPHGFSENDPLDGGDPYSNSKSCSELVTHSYCASFFRDGGPAVSTARAGNVIGGGDFAPDRIIPDCARAASKGETIIVRNPHSIRPYQHVLEPLFAYLLIAKEQLENPELAGAYNVGPDDSGCAATGDLTDLFCKAWGEGASWQHRAEANAPREADYLKLNAARLRETFGWNPVWEIETAVRHSAEWYRAYYAGENMLPWMDRQIDAYINDAEKAPRK